MVSASSIAFPRHLRCSKGWYALVNEIPSKPPSSDNSVDGDFHETHNFVPSGTESDSSQVHLASSSFVPVPDSHYVHGENYIPTYEPRSVSQPSLDSQSGIPIHGYPSLPHEYSASGNGSVYQGRNTSPYIHPTSWAINAARGIPSHMEHGTSPHDQYFPNFDQDGNGAPQAIASLERRVSIPVSMAVPEYNIYGGPLGHFQPTPGSSQPTSRERLAGAPRERDSFRLAGGGSFDTYFQDYDEIPEPTFVTNAARYILL